MAPIATELSRAFRLPDIAEKDAAYKKLVDKAVAGLKKDDTIAIIQHMINKEGAEQNGRTYTTPSVLNHLVDLIGQEMPEDADESKYFDLDAQREIAQCAVDSIRSKADDFPTQLMKATRLLSECYQAEGDFKHAARTLTSFKFDGYRQPVECTPADKVRWYVDTCMFYLEDDDTGAASNAINRARVLVNDLDKTTDLFIQFKTCFARVKDAQRDFLAAAREYHFLSQFYGKVEESQLLESLKYAVTCAILAPAGPERTRRLAILYADERSSQLPNFQMLEKMFKERIIRKSDAEKFEKLLAEHQNAMTGNGRTVLQNAIISHNMLAASKIYNNITFSELGGLLGIHATKAEALARTMIEAKDMQGTIDQVEGIVEFKDRTGSLLDWDQQISSVCVAVNQVLDNISSKHPQYTY